MPNQLAPKFVSVPSDSNACVCHGCHRIGRVLKIALPQTRYYDGINLETHYTKYCLCESCAEKLVFVLRPPKED